MKKFPLVRLLPAIPILWAGFLRLADGQEDRLVLHPPLSQIFPLDSTSSGMRLKFPILLNERTILGPDVVLRFIYIDPNAGARPHGGGNGGDQGGGGHGHHHGGSSDGGDAGSAYSRSASGQGGGDAAPAPAASGANKDSTNEIRTEVWTQPNLFREALDGAVDMGTTLVYSAPGKQKPQSTTIDLPDGMLLAEIGGHVRVLGLTDNSRAFQSGVQPDDEIRSLEGRLPVASLADFARIYFKVQEEARRNVKSYSIEVWRPSESRLVTILVAAPPSLHSLL